MGFRWRMKGIVEGIVTGLCVRILFRDLEFVALEKMGIKKTTLIEGLVMWKYRRIGRL